MIMRHGWSVIRDEHIDRDDRIYTAIGFCSTTAIMLAAILFFSFRVNSTLLMTVLMLGIMEGIYLRNNDMITQRKGLGSDSVKLLLPLIIIVLIGVVWFTGIKPFKGEVEHFRHKLAISRKDGRSAERHILKAIEYDPHNSAYHVYAAQFYFNIVKDYIKASDYVGTAINDFNGDVTLYSIHYLNGLIKYRMGSLFEARKSFEKALYYNPTMKEASDRLSEVNNIIKDSDRVTIKYR
jgi:tetratricopeptide (TPR) repeat protein